MEQNGNSLFVVATHVLVDSILDVMYSMGQFS